MDHVEIADVLRRIAQLPENWHQHGVMSSTVLEAIARHIGARPVANSMETGTGKTTLLLSQLSKCHWVFTLDDAGMGDSLNRVRESPLMKSETTNFVVGPTQKTLPAHRFEQPLQFALIDGPHAYPFPELEYWCVYPHLSPGAILVLDDIHIPNIGNMFRFLREDDMFELLEIVRATAFLRRTSAPTFDPFGDGWHHQNYTRRRFPAHVLWSERFKARLPTGLKQFLKARGYR